MTKGAFSALTAGLRELLGPLRRFVPLVTIWWVPILRVPSFILIPNN